MSKPQKTRRRVIAWVMLGIVLLSLLTVGFRVVQRWSAFEKYYGKSHWVSHLMMTPEQPLEIPPLVSDAHRVVNIGYAQFSLPEELDFDVSAAGSHDELVMLQTDDLNIAIFMPWGLDRKVSQDLIELFEEAGMSRTDMRYERLLHGKDTDPIFNDVDLQRFASEAYPQPLITVLMMDEIAFKTHMLQLTFKELYHSAERILPFQTAHNVGIILVNEGGRRYLVRLTSHDRSVSQDIAFSMSSPQVTFPEETLLAFLASYQITATLPTSDEDYGTVCKKIGAMIATAGIVRKDEQEQSEEGEIDIQSNSVED